MTTDGMTPTGQMAAASAAPAGLQLTWKRFQDRANIFLLLFTVKHNESCADSVACLEQAISMMG